MYLEGFIQEAQHDPQTSQTSRLYFPTQYEGQACASDAVPTVAIYSPGGDALVAATNMTWTEASSGTAWLNYDTGTGDFTVGLDVEGGTSGHTGTIVELRELTSATGVLKLADITGAFEDNEALTDSSTGAAAVNGTAHSNLAYYDLDTSSATNYEAGENYRADVVFNIAARVNWGRFFFDCVMHPFGDPLVTTEHIDELHPDWKREHPSGSDGTWVQAIEAAHVELARRIRAMGKRARCIIKREELFPYERALAEAFAAERIIGMPPTERKFYRDRAENLWAARGEFAYEDDDTAAIDSLQTTTLTAKLTR